ncbi:MAG: hypothetical protein P8M03_02805 [Flavobacteriaceae bacterium]|nr:hypothetical protein [Flavobacteriaceae bacterium]
MKKFTDGFFDINAKNGFLPKKDPIVFLPNRYQFLQELIDDLPMLKSNKTGGILSIDGEIEKRTSDLPDYTKKVLKETNPFILQALFRSYAFISSAYTLAPAHFHFLKTGKYGKAHRLLPQQIAKPFVAVSKIIDVYPWLDYHYAYSLGNYVKLNPSRGFNWENLGMAAKFSGMQDERGFIMLHVDINQHSPSLVKAVLNTRNSKNMKQLNNGIELAVSTMKNVNQRRKLMWEASRWKHYNDFRVFIMGILGNGEIFGEGLVYEGVSKEPKKYRGQTGAQDNIIPLMDIFSGIINHYPKNELTHYLKDLRSYRPKCVQRFLEDNRLFFSSKKNSLLLRLKKNNNYDGILLLLDLHEEIYHFRNGHWQFVQKYIMQNTVYPKATGGTPIISWIPNQIIAVLNSMYKCYKALPSQLINKKIPDWKKDFDKKTELLENQLKILNQESFKVNEVYDLNKKMNLQD